MDYQLHFLDGRGETPFMDLCQAQDDGEALRIAARRMEDHGSCVGVRVYDGERMVCQLVRPPAAPAIHGAGPAGADDGVPPPAAREEAEPPVQEPL